MLIVVYSANPALSLDRLDVLPAGVEISTDRRRLAQADAVVFHIPDLRFWWRPRKRPGQIWIAWSLESEANYPKLSDPRFMAQFDLRMTYRRDADVLWSYVPYYSSAENLRHALVAPPAEKTAPQPVAMFISSGIDRSGRRRYARELARHIPIDSFGSFLRNATIADDRGRPSKLATIARYPFTIAFENSIADDYVTEKFYDPLVMGSVPIYLGATNVSDFAPGDRCYLDVRDFAGPAALAAHLHALLASPPAYAELLAWKQRPLRPEFLEFLDRQSTHPWQRLCEAITQLTRQR